MVFLNEGDPAPAFTGRDQDGNEISLEDFRGKRLVLFIYPKDNTPGCTAEACNLRDNYQQFLEEGFEVVGISADSEQSHRKFIDKHDLPFRLIADKDKQILEAYGAWGEKKLYGRSFLGILRKTFVISPEGMIEKIIGKVKTKEHTQQIFKELSH